MSIEDINYLKANSIKQTYTFLIDSNERDRQIYPNPNNYVIEFSTPFRNIIAMEIIDASIPRTMYNVDIENNSIYYYIGTGDDDVLITDGVNNTNNCDIEVYNANIEDTFLRIILDRSSSDKDILLESNNSFKSSDTTSFFIFLISKVILSLST